MRALALILALIPSLAFAEPIKIGPDSDVSTYRPMDGATKIKGVPRDLAGLDWNHRDLVTDRGVIRTTKPTDSNTTVRNSTFKLKKPTRGTALPVALEYVDGSDHLIENVVAMHFRMEPVEGKYANGDCFSGERRAKRITFRNTLASDCSDGGYDFKSIDVRFENATAEDVGKCYRIWGTATASTITCRRWRDGAIQMNWVRGGPSASFEVDKLVLEPDASTEGVLVGVRDDVTLNIKSCAGSLGSPERKLIYWNNGSPETTRLTLCGVPVTTKDEAVLRPLIEAQMAKDAQPRAAAASIAPSAPAVLCTFPTKLRDTSGDGVVILGKANAAKCGGKANMRVRLLSERPGAFGYGLAN